MRRAVVLGGAVLVLAAGVGAALAAGYLFNVFPRSAVEPPLPTHVAGWAASGPVAKETVRAADGGGAAGDMPTPASEGCGGSRIYTRWRAVGSSVLRVVPYADLDPWNHPGEGPAGLSLDPHLLVQQAAEVGLAGLITTDGCQIPIFFTTSGTHAEDVQLQWQEWSPAT